MARPAAAWAGYAAWNLRTGAPLGLADAPLAGTIVPGTAGGVPGAAFDGTPARRLRYSGHNRLQGQAAGWVLVHLDVAPAMLGLTKGPFTIGPEDGPPDAQQVTITQRDAAAGSDPVPEVMLFRRRTPQGGAYHVTAANTHRSGPQVLVGAFNADRGIGLWRNGERLGDHALQSFPGQPTQLVDAMLVGTGPGAGGDMVGTIAEIVFCGRYAPSDDRIAWETEQRLRPDLIATLSDEETTLTAGTHVLATPLRLSVSAGTTALIDPAKDAVLGDDTTCHLDSVDPPDQGGTASVQNGAMAFTPAAFYGLTSR